MTEEQKKELLYDLLCVFFDKGFKAGINNEKGLLLRDCFDICYDQNLHEILELIK